MSSRVVLVQAEQTIARRERGAARDGWRVFASPRTGFEIAIPAYQVARIEAIAKRERSEWYALVVGELLQDEHGVHAVVRDLVPNDWAERGRAHVRMGATAEAQVRELARELHPTLHPLGNLHTHQHFTTRASGTDRQEFWSDPNSVSIIIDPFDRPTMAVYRGREGERLVEVAGGPRPEPPRPVAPVILPVPSPPLTPAPGRLSRMRPLRSMLDRVHPFALVGALVLTAAAFGLPVVLDRLIDKRLAELSAMGAELRVRVAVLEAQTVLVPAPEEEGQKPDDALVCVAPGAER